MHYVANATNYVIRLCVSLLIPVRTQARGVIKSCACDLVRAVRTQRWNECQRQQNVGKTSTGEGKRPDICSTSLLPYLSAI